MSYLDDPKNITRIQLLIELYQQRIFTLVLYLILGDKDKAYEVTTSSFVEAIGTTPLFKKEEFFLSRVLLIAIKKSQNVKAIPSLDESCFADFPPHKKLTLQMAKTALFTLSFESRVLVLLRDQLHLPYKEIGEILRLTEKDTKIQITVAKSNLRKKMEEVLKGVR